MKEVDAAIETEVKRRLAVEDAKRDVDTVGRTIIEAIALVRRARKIIARQKAGGVIDKLNAVEKLLDESGAEVNTMKVESRPKAESP